MPQCTVYKVNAIQDATGRWHEVQQHRCRNRVCKGSLESELSNCDAKGGSQGDNECDMVCGAHFAKAERAWYDSAYGDDGFMVGFGTTWGRS